MLVVHAMIIKPGVSELKDIWVRHDKLSNPFLRQVYTISVTEQKYA